MAKNRFRFHIYLNTSYDFYIVDNDYPLLSTKRGGVELADKRYFVLIQGKRETAVFTGKQPRQAALKAASRGYTDIKLRERGTNKIHVYRGSRRKVPAPFNRPDWMSSMVWKPNVRKIGLVKIEKKKPKVAKKKKVKRVAKKKKAPKRKKAAKRKVSKKKSVKRKATKRKATKKKSAKKRRR